MRPDAARSNSKSVADTARLCAILFRTSNTSDRSASNVPRSSRLPATRPSEKTFDQFGSLPTISNSFRVCRDLIGNTICADLLDYLHRDWLHLGKPKHFDDRLLEYLEIRSRLIAG